jgi:hypothetical protein
MFWWNVKNLNRSLLTVLFFSVVASSAMEPEKSENKRESIILKHGEMEITVSAAIAQKFPPLKAMLKKRWRKGSTYEFSSEYTDTQVAKFLALSGLGHSNNSEPCRIGDVLPVVSLAEEFMVPDQLKLFIISWAVREIEYAGRSIEENVKHHAQIVHKLFLTMLPPKAEMCEVLLDALEVTNEEELCAKEKQTYKSMYAGCWYKRIASKHFEDCFQFFEQADVYDTIVDIKEWPTDIQDNSCAIVVYKKPVVVQGVLTPEQRLSWNNAYALWQSMFKKEKK